MSTRKIEIARRETTQLRRPAAATFPAENVREVLALSNKMPPRPPGAGTVRPCIEMPSSLLSQSAAWVSARWGRGDAEWLRLAAFSRLATDLAVRQPPRRFASARLRPLEARSMLAPE